MFSSDRSNNGVPYRNRSPIHRQMSPKILGWDLQRRRSPKNSPVVSKFLFWGKENPFALRSAYQPRQQYQRLLVLAADLIAILGPQNFPVCSPICSCLELVIRPNHFAPRRCRGTHTASRNTQRRLRVVAFHHKDLERISS